MYGRTEQELKSEKKVLNKLLSYPDIFTEFYYDMKDNGKSYLTCDNYINYLINFAEFFSDGEISDDFYKNVTPADIKKYMTSMKIKEDSNGNLTEVGDRFRATNWSGLNCFFDFLVENHYVDNNPVTKTKRPKPKTEHQVTYLEPEEIKAMLQKIKDEAKPRFVARDLCIISLMIATGLRCNAVCNINISDIDLKENTISVIEKGSKHRKISFGENIKKLIEDCIKERRRYFGYPETDALFITQWRERIRHDTIENLVRKYTKGVTNKHITPHKLRATCAVTIYNNTKDILVVKEILGHDNITTTQIYTCASEDGKREAVKAMDSMF